MKKKSTSILNNKYFLIVLLLMLLGGVIYLMYFSNYKISKPFRAETNTVHTPTGKNIIFFPRTDVSTQSLLDQFKPNESGVVPINTRGLDGIVLNRSLPLTLYNVGLSMNFTKDIGYWTFKSRPPGEDNQAYDPLDPRGKEIYDPNSPDIFPNAVNALMNSSDFQNNEVVNNNFELVNFGTGANVAFDWFDNDKWNVYKENWKNTIKTVKDTNLRGIFFDFESYNLDPYYAGLPCYITVNDKKTSGGIDCEKRIGQNQFEMPLLSLNKRAIINDSKGNSNTSTLATDGNYWDKEKSMFLADENNKNMLDFSINLFSKNEYNEQTKKYECVEGINDDCTYTTKGNIDEIAVYWLDQYKNIANWSLEVKHGVNDQWETIYEESPTVTDNDRKISILRPSSITVWDSAKEELPSGKLSSASHIRLRATGKDPNTIIGMYEIKVFGVPEYQTQLSFEQYQTKAKERGMALMEKLKEAKVAEDTEKTFDVVFTVANGALQTIKDYYGPNYNPKWTLKEDRYGLVPSFIDGLLEGSETYKEKIKFYDGFESSFGYKTKAQFEKARSDMIKSKELSSRSDYKERVGVAFGLWVDQNESWKINNNIVNTEGAYYSPDEFKEALNYALRYTDDLVWVFGYTPNLIDNSSNSDPNIPVPEEYINAFKESRVRLNDEDLVPEMPSINPIAFVGIESRYIFKTIGEDGDVINVDILEMPDNATYTKLDDGKSILSWIPNQDQKGQIYNITIEMTDGINKITKTYAVTVSDNVTLDNIINTKGVYMISFPNISQEQDFSFLNAIASPSDETDGSGNPLKKPNFYRFSQRLLDSQSATGGYYKYGMAGSENFGNPQAGMGYWLYVRTDDKVNLVKNIKYGEISQPQNSYTIEIEKGWNLLGNPFKQAIGLSKIFVNLKDGQRLSFADASKGNYRSQRKVEPYLWSYDPNYDNAIMELGEWKPSQYNYISEDNRFDGTHIRNRTNQIQAFHGFWLIVNSDDVKSIEYTL